MIVKTVTKFDNKHSEFKCSKRLPKKINIIGALPNFQDHLKMLKVSQKQLHYVVLSLKEMRIKKLTSKLPQKYVSCFR